MTTNTITVDNFGIAYIHPRFKEYFGEPEVTITDTKLYTKKLPRDMVDEEIQRELKPTEVTLDDIFSSIRGECGRQYTGYVRDKNGVLRTVRVLWDGGGWHVYANAVGHPNAWRADYQVFSRNSFDTQDTETQTSGDLDAIASEEKRFRALYENEQQMARMYQDSLAETQTRHRREMEELQKEIIYLKDLIKYLVK